MKNKIKNFFTYYSFVIILSLVFFSALFYVVNYNLYKPKNYEKISLFIEASDTINRNYGADLEKKIIDKTKNSEHPVYEVTDYLYSANNSSLTSYYEKFGKSSDILILKEEDLTDLKENDILNESFIKINDSMNERINTLGFDVYLDNSSNVYGYYVYKKDDSQYNEKFNFDKVFNVISSYNYIILFNINSVNFLDDVNQSHITSNAFIALDFMYEMNKEGTYYVAV